MCLCLARGQRALTSTSTCESFLNFLFPRLEFWWPSSALRFFQDSTHWLAILKISGVMRLPSSSSHQKSVVSGGSGLSEYSTLRFKLEFSASQDTGQSKYSPSFFAASKSLLKMKSRSSSASLCPGSAQACKKSEPNRHTHLASSYSQTGLPSRFEPVSKYIRPPLIYLLATYPRPQRNVRLPMCHDSHLEQHESGRYAWV